VARNQELGPLLAVLVVRLPSPPVPVETLRRPLLMPLELVVR
jgi:hypothetical protein